MTARAEPTARVESHVVRVICGPTGAGKTGVALALANELPVTVISADSRQLYRRFDIGTAKPSAEERARVPHLGIDVLDPIERSSAAWWADRADAWLRATLDAGREPVVVGGTGLYLRALLGTLFDEPPMDEERRAELRHELATLDTDELRRWVARLDPDRAALGRTQLLRAIEIALLTGRRVSELHRERVRPPRWRARYLVVDPGPSLASQIQARTDAMLAQGWREEVRALIRDVPEGAPAWNATGYRTIRQLELGEISQDEAIKQVIIETRQYAKRQRTWFRHQLGGEQVTRLDPRDPNGARLALAWWNECGR